MIKKSEIIKKTIGILIVSLLFSCQPKKTNDDLGQLKKVFQELNICLNIEEKDWNDSIVKNPNLKSEWRYFCDTTYFKIHKVGHNIAISDILLLEVKVNHGSGEYDNYFIKKTEKGYKITCEFKGYLDSILISNKPFYKFVYQFNTTTEKSCKVLGSFNGENIVTDTILDFELTECKDTFYKGSNWCEL